MDIQGSVIKQLLSQVRYIQNLRGQKPKIPGEDFNVFSLLIPSNQEELTHCRLLYELLRPDGSHGFGDRFLRAFFETVLNRPFPEHTKVSRERSFDFGNKTDYGRMDLLLEGSDSCFPIEVKIHADDQYRQIERYVSFASAAHEHHVYYLTLDGHEPSPESIGAAKGDDYSCVSFVDNIQPWLLRCGEIAWQAPAITEIIQQYSRLLEQLTGKRKRDEYQMMIEEIIGHSKETYESATEIEKALASLRANMMVQIFSEIEEHIAAHFGNRLPKIRSTYQNDAERFYSPERKKIWPSLTYLVAKCGELNIALHIEVEWNLYHGLIFFKSDDFQQVPNEISAIVNAFPNPEWEEFISSFHPKDWWLWYKYLTEETPIDFKHCTGRYSELYDPEGHRKLMQEIFNQLDRDIEYALETGCCNITS